MMLLKMLLTFFLFGASGSDDVALDTSCECGTLPCRPDVRCADKATDPFRGLGCNAEGKAHCRFVILDCDGDSGNARKKQPCYEDTRCSGATYSHGVGVNGAAPDLAKLTSQTLGCNAAGHTDLRFCGFGPYFRCPLAYAPGAEVDGVPVGVRWVIDDQNATLTWHVGDNALASGSGVRDVLLDSTPFVTNDVTQGPIVHSSAHPSALLVALAAAVLAMVCAPVLKTLVQGGDGGNATVEASAAEATVVNEPAVEATAVEAPAERAAAEARVAEEARAEEPTGAVNNLDAAPVTPPRHTKATDAQMTQPQPRLRSVPMSNVLQAIPMRSLDDVDIAATAEAEAASYLSAAEAAELPAATAAISVAAEAPALEAATEEEASRVETKAEAVKAPLGEPIVGTTIDFHGDGSVGLKIHLSDCAKLDAAAPVVDAPAADEPAVDNALVEARTSPRFVSHSQWSPQQPFVSYVAPADKAQAAARQAELLVASAIVAALPALAGAPAVEVPTVCAPAVEAPAVETPVFEALAETVPVALDHVAEEELISAVVRVKARHCGDVNMTARAVFETLQQEGADWTLSQVKKAASKAVRRTHALSA